MRVSTVGQMRELDARAVRDFGISEEVLMENAGAAAYGVLAREIEGHDGRIAVVCGTGNNGGDGLVVARRIAAGGGTPSVWVVGDPGKFTGAAERNWKICRRMEVPVHRVDTDPQALIHALRHCRGVVDGLFGTGLTRAPAGPYQEAIDAVNACGAPVLSLDIPSGVDGDTGQVSGVAVRADATITFGLPKIGDLLYPGCDLCGRLYVSNISFPLQLTGSPELRVSTNELLPLPERPPAGHKGDFGEALIVAGGAAYYGAPYLAAAAFLRAGGGYARLAAPASIVGVLASLAPEVVYHPQQETAGGTVAASNLGAILELAGSADVLVVGPGLSRDEDAAALVCRLVGATTGPMVVDGDGLTALSQDPSVPREDLVLTPHAGELSRLIGWAVERIEADRVGAVREACDRYGAVVVLKGAHSLIGSPAGEVWVNLTGNSGMATPGSGDVLAGVVAAMMGRGMPACDGARMGVLFHGVAGDIAAQSGEDGVMARDILAGVPGAIQRVRKGAVAPRIRRTE